MGFEESGDDLEVEQKLSSSDKLVSVQKLAVFGGISEIEKPGAQF